MTTRWPIHTWHPVVIMGLVVGLVMLALTMQARGAAAVTLDDATDGQQLLCRVLGSHPDVPVTRTNADGHSFVQVACHEGLLDGATCDIIPGTDADDPVISSCYLAGAPEDIHVTPVGGIEDVSDTGGPGGVGDVAVDPVVAEDPTRREPVVPPGFSVDALVKALTDGCDTLGGADVEIARPEAGDSPRSIDVRCVGGPHYDLHCTVAVEFLTCQWLEPVVEPTVDVVVEDVRVVGTAPTPVIAEQIDTPVDDDSGMDPTAPPTFTAPDNVGDNGVPAGGGVEDPARSDPTPTEAPLR